MVHPSRNLSGRLSRHRQLSGWTRDRGNAEVGV